MHKGSREKVAPSPTAETHCAWGSSSNDEPGTNEESTHVAQDSNTGRGKGETGLGWVFRGPHAAHADRQTGRPADQATGVEDCGRGTVAFQTSPWQFHVYSEAEYPVSSSSTRMRPGQSSQCAKGAMGLREREKRSLLYFTANRWKPVKPWIGCREERAEDPEHRSSVSLSVSQSLPGTREREREIMTGLLRTCSYMVLSDLHSILPISSTLLLALSILSPT